MTLLVLFVDLHLLFHLRVQLADLILEKPVSLLLITIKQFVKLLLLNFLFHYLPLQALASYCLWLHLSTPKALPLWCELLSELIVAFCPIRLGGAH